MHKRPTHKHSFLPTRSAADTEQVLLALAHKHFGANAHWSSSLWEFLHDVKSSLHHSHVHGAHAAHESPSTPVVDANKHDALRAIRNLQNLVVRLRRDRDGNIVYTLREGRLAGEHTTDQVLNRPINEFIDNTALNDVLQHVERAFRGEVVQFEYDVNGRTYLRLLAPITDERTNEVQEVVGSLTDITAQKETERQLRSSEHLFRKLIDSIPIGILKQETHADGMVHNEVANAEFQRISGYSVDELWSMTPQERSDLIHAEDRPTVISRWSAWLYDPTGETLNMVYRFRHRDGNYRIFQNYLVKFRSEEGNLVCVQAVLDITSRTANEDKLRHLASYLEQSVKPIFEITRSGDISYMNSAACTTFSDLRDMGLYHPALVGFRNITAKMESDQQDVVKRIITVRDEYYDQAIHFMPEAQVYRVFCHNITTLKRAEEELRTSLEQERALSLMRSSFIDTISHEFRTPLTGINTSAELLQRYDSAMTHEERLMHVEAIRSRVQDIVNLVARFTAQSSLRNLRDSFMPSSLDIVSVVRRILEEIRSFVTDHKQHLKYQLPSCPLIISGDERLLRQALRNILLNAVQYSGDGTTLELSCSHDSESILFTITDSGIGIPERELELLFTPYYRGSNVSTLPGTGLGMSVAKEFIELHKGSVHVQSQVGKGTSVTITLPLVKDGRGMNGTLQPGKDATTL